MLKTTCIMWLWWTTFIFPTVVFVASIYSIWPAQCKTYLANIPLSKLTEVRTKNTIESGYGKIPVQVTKDVTSVIIDWNQHHGRQEMTSTAGQRSQGKYSLVKYKVKFSGWTFYQHSFSDANVSVCNWTLYTSSYKNYFFFIWINVYQFYSIHLCKCF